MSNKKPKSTPTAPTKNPPSGPVEPASAPVSGKPPPQKLAALREIVEEMEKSFGKGAVMLLGERPPVPEKVIPSGSLALDRALGIGGYPAGRVCEVYGPESSGKTTLTLHAIAQVQSRGGLAAFIDAEHAFDVRYAQAIGVDPRQLIVSQPDYGEQALEIAEILTRTQVVDLIVIDSVAALVPRAEVEGDMGDAHMGLQARLMSQGLRKLTSCAAKAGTTLMFINQLRQKIGVTFGNPETTTGGNALKFYASVRLDVRRIGKVAAGDDVVGNRTRVKVVKNKCAPPFSEAEFDIRWGIGVDAVTDLLETALSVDVVARNGSHFAFEGKSFGQGRERAREALLGDAVLHDAVARRTAEALLKRGECAGGVAGDYHAARVDPAGAPLAAPTMGEDQRANQKAA